MNLLEKIDKMNDRIDNMNGWVAAEVAADLLGIDVADFQRLANTTDFWWVWVNPLSHAPRYHLTFLYHRFICSQAFGLELLLMRDYHALQTGKAKKSRRQVKRDEKRLWEPINQALHQCSEDFDFDEGFQFESMEDENIAAHVQQFLYYYLVTLLRPGEEDFYVPEATWTGFIRTCRYYGIELEINFGREAALDLDAPTDS